MVSVAATRDIRLRAAARIPFTNAPLSRYDERVISPENRRAHPRVELVATVEVAASGGELIILTATNLSIGGVFLEANPSDFPLFRRGVLVELSISLADSAALEDEDASIAPPPHLVHARGKIVRIQVPAPGTPAGYGIVLTDLPPAELDTLKALLAQAPKAPGLPGKASSPKK